MFFYNWFNPALILPCVKNVGYSAAGTLADIDQIKQANKSCHKKQNQKTLENIEKIREYLSKNNISKTSDIAEYIGLSLPRTRAILKEIPDVSPIGNNTNRKWTLQK